MPLEQKMKRHPFISGKMLALKKKCLLFFSEFSVQLTFLNSTVQSLYKAMSEVHRNEHCFM